MLRGIEVRKRMNKNVRSRRRRRLRIDHKSAWYWPAHLALFWTLLFLPARAALTITTLRGFALLAGYVAIVSVGTLLAYWLDKRKAQRDQWRIPEVNLHFLDLIGGWPAGYIAQRAFRHKISKTSYQVAFWLIIALHQYAALDLAQHWKWTKSIHALLSPA
jgi:uncharacterized membrane protein YsdA (DUF1294 family)